MSWDKDEKEAISQIIDEMFDEAADWLYVQ
ncbi:DinI family protein [Photobacterium damselae subsp. damselae]|nr:DinI family protein [Photobacterium damselae subsp. damselae]